MESPQRQQQQQLSWGGRSLLVPESREAQVEAQKSKQALAQLQGEVDALRTQLAWHEKERVRAQQHAARLQQEVEGARAEAKRHQEALRERMALEADLGEARERERQAREEAERDRAELLRRLQTLDASRADMRNHITKLDMYLVNLARELDGAREAKEAAEAREAGARRELEGRGEALGALANDLQGLSKALQRTQSTRRSFERVFANVQAALERFRASTVVNPAEVGRKLTAALLTQTSPQRRGGREGGGAVVIGALEEVVGDLRRWLAEAQAFCPQLLDEVAVGRRESEFLSAELQELSGRLNKALARSSITGAPLEGGADGARVREPEALALRLHELDDASEEIAQMLRGLVRGRVGNVQVLLRTAHEQQAELMAQAERLRREVALARTAAADAGDARERLQQVWWGPLLLMQHARATHACGVCGLVAR
jgi:chromosome segregation ATPase